MAQLVSWDRTANAAYIGFREIEHGEAVKQLLASHESGDIAAVLDFTADGELLGIELLDADHQLPRELRD